MMVLLEVTAGPHGGARFEFDRHATFLVGRSPDAHLRLDEDRHFSRHHLLLELNPPCCFLRDLSSTNGTFVNGRRVAQTYLKDGDEISGGNTRIRVSLSSGAARAGVGDPTSLRLSEADASATVAWGTVPGRPCDELTGPPSTFPTEDVVPRVPGYDLIRELGRGGMGVVYHVRQQATGAERAMKVVIPEAAASEKALALFLREVSVLSQLSHERIVRFLEMGVAERQFYFVMEYVPTIDLRELLAARSGPARIRTACGLLCQLLDGLAHAHGRGFVHRDIKPSNLLVERRGTTLRVKLGDFGLAKNFWNAGFSGMTMDGQALGTMAFVAPEQVIDARRATPSVDVYSAGAMLYYLIGGRSPHATSQHRDLILAVLEGSAARLEGLCPEIPLPLADIVHRSLARDPDDRFSSALDFRQALVPFAAKGATS